MIIKSIFSQAIFSTQSCTRQLFKCYFYDEATASRCTSRYKRNSSPAQKITGFNTLHPLLERRQWLCCLNGNTMPAGTLFTLKYTDITVSNAKVVLASFQALEKSEGAPDTHCLRICGSPGFSGELGNYCIHLRVASSYIIGSL